MTVTVTCTPASGAAVELNDPDSGCEVLKGAVGLDGPPVSNNISAYLSSDGGVLVKARRTVRPIVLPLILRHATRAQTKVAEIATAFMAGPSTITFSDGINTRELQNVIYEAGLEGDWARDRSLPTWHKVAVSLLALDPWWYGATDTVAFQINIQVAFDDAATTFDAVVSFDAASTNPILVEGDAPAFPVTTIVGPFDTLQVGLAGGQSFALAAPLADGDIVTVDTRPGSRGPSRNGGAIDWSLLTPASRLWELQVGTSVMNVAATGESGSSGIEMSWRERWLTP